MRTTDLIALNDHLHALAKAGLPIDAALPNSSVLSSKLSELTRDVERDLMAGKTLDQVLDDMSGRVPEFYRCALKTAQRTGELASCTESVSRSLRHLVQLRRTVRMASWYPLFVAMLGCGLAATFLAPMLGPILIQFDMFNQQPPVWMRRVSSVVETLGPFVGIIPMVCIALLAARWWWVSGAAGSGIGAYSWIPGGWRTLRNGRLAVFCEVLQLLVTHEVPFGDALRLAASASNDASIRRDAELAADRLQRGEKRWFQNEASAGIPFFVRQICQPDAPSRQLAERLGDMADVYRQRCEQSARQLGLTLPLLTMVVIGGGTILVYGMVSLGPWYSFLQTFTTG